MPLKPPPEITGVDDIVWKTLLSIVAAVVVIIALAAAWDASSRRHVPTTYERLLAYCIQHTDADLEACLKAANVFKNVD